MMKSLMVLCAMAGLIGLSACSEMEHRRGETIGTAGGAVAGGAVGSGRGDPL